MVAQELKTLRFLEDVRRDAVLCANGREQRVGRGLIEQEVGGARLDLSWLDLPADLRRCCPRARPLIVETQI